MKIETLEKYETRRKALSTAKGVLRIVAFVIFDVFLLTMIFFNILAIRTVLATTDAKTELAAAPARPVVPAAPEEERETAQENLNAAAPGAKPDVPYTLEDVIMLSQMVWAEARGLPPEEQALCVWTVINRLEAGNFGASIADVITRPGQFAYDPSYPVVAEIKETAEGALEDWAAGAEAPTLPPYATEPGYLYFNGGHIDEHGVPHNYFR